MIVADITELSIATVLKRGVPNNECIAIQVNERVNLGQYGIMLGTSYRDNSAIPFRDNLFWFGDAVVEAGDWVFIYTGAGKPTQTKAVNQINDVYSIFWGRLTTIFANTNVVPILFRIDAVNILRPPGDLPQLGRKDA